MEYRLSHLQYTIDKLKRFIDIHIPIETCNLRCSYCYITQHVKFNNIIPVFTHSPQFIRLALSKKRLGGVALLNICAGGETLLSDELITIIENLLDEGHYLMLVTNGTLTQQFKKIAAYDKYKFQKLFIKFSFHYAELKRTDKLSVFFDNINMMSESGCSFTVELTPSDDLIPLIPEIKSVCLQHLGTLCHVTVTRDERTGGIKHLSSLNFEDYIKIWSVFNSPLFDFKSKIFYVQRKEFCYAGVWSGYLDLVTGELKQCYKGCITDNIYRDIKSPIRFAPIGSNCREPHCYNGHAFLTLGTIPELNTPFFESMRNRTTNNGKEWLQPAMKHFMRQKLADNNLLLSWSGKKVANLNQRKHILNDKIFKFISNYLNRDGY